MQGKNNHSDKPALDYLFHPRSIAVTGVSTNTTGLNFGQMLLKCLISAEFNRKLYPVGRGSEVFGLKIYPSIKDVPEAVDYVISALPAPLTPQLIADGATKGVKAIQMFTAGFSETGSEEGRELERQITTLARRKGIRLIGPNCMGLYCPKTRLAFGTDFPKKSGSIGFIAQSGGNSIYAIREAATRGIYFSKVTSYGNACDLNGADFLEYLAQDPETKIITAYIEGLKDGQRFIKVLRQAAREKPVIIFKGGTTEIGAKTAASHTSAIAGSGRIWHSLLQQVGAIQVYSIEELVDVALLFTYMSPPRGKNTAVIGLGGGASVQAADVCSNAGLAMPTLPVEIRQRLKDILGMEAGNIFNNPLDLYHRGRQELIEQAVKVIANYDQIDLLIMQIPFDMYAIPMAKPLGLYIKSLIKLSKGINKRTAVVLSFIASAEYKQITFARLIALSKAGFPVYPSVSRAANAISKFIQYHRRQQMSGYGSSQNPQG